MREKLAPLNHQPANSSAPVSSHKDMNRDIRSSLNTYDILKLHQITESMRSSKEDIVPRGSVVDSADDQMQNPTTPIAHSNQQGVVNLPKMLVIEGADGQALYGSKDGRDGLLVAK